MRTIYIDSDFKCHASNDGTMTAVETDFFDGKCDAYIEGFYYKISENTTEIYAFKQYNDLYDIQREYEQQRLLELESNQNELNTSYQEGINSI